MTQADSRSPAVDADIMRQCLSELDAMKLDMRSKGVPAPAETSKLAGTGWNVLAGDLPFPLAVLKQTALQHNSNWMRRFLSATGVSLAPHGKTTMAPQLFARQLEDGCWGITVATAQQAIVCAQAGIRRILMANQLVGPANIAQILGLLGSVPELDFYCYVDSIDGVSLLAEVLRAHHDLSLNVLLEMGVKGGRTGCRSIADASRVLDALAKVEGIKLRGVAGFEGMIHGASQAETEAQVTAFLDLMADAFMLCRQRQAFASDGEAIISAGGSSFFDIVALRLKEMRDPGPTRVVIRSGCYLTHDSGLYDNGFPELARRLPPDLAQQLGRLQPGLFVWSCVQSRPEPGLALLTMGRRDASHDAGLPVPVLRGRVGSAGTTPLDRHWQIRQMNDQHAYLQLPETADLQVGDLVCCGISHPCTTFDKWRVIPLVDDNWSITGAVHTYF
ncbi:MAG: amino acid deaminase [Rhodospirillaceae bacterium]|nr:MAG: amino acid deaminase [Rhodospirillaceae bacterium]